MENKLVNINLLLTVLVIINRDTEDIKIRFEIFNAFKFNIEVCDKKDKKLKK